MKLLRLPTSHFYNGFRLVNPESVRLPPISRVSVSLSLPLITHRTQFQSLVVCARKKRKRVGNPRITRFLFKSLSFLSSNLQIVPPPLDLVIADLGGVDGRGGGGGGGGLGFWRGWGRFDGWRRKRNRVPILVFVCVVLWIYGYCRISGKGTTSDEVLKAIGLCLSGVAVVKELKREAIVFVFGFLCFIVASLGFGFKGENLARFASQVRSSCSSLLRRRQKSRRRVF